VKALPLFIMSSIVNYTEPVSQGPISRIEQQFQVQRHRLFVPTHYGLLDFPDNVSTTITDIANFLKVTYRGEKIQLIGTGTSGAMLMALLQHKMIDISNVMVNAIIIMKRGESTHRRPLSSPFQALPTILIDDHISSGDTIAAIHKVISERAIHNGTSEGIPFNNYVEVVAAEHTSSHVPSLKHMFPNLKYIIE
jgi:hypothetical protein